jgi:hypothetical protein
MRWSGTPHAWCSYSLKQSLSLILSLSHRGGCGIVTKMGLSDGSWKEGWGIRSRSRSQAAGVLPSLLALLLMRDRDKHSEGIDRELV